MGRAVYPSFLRSAVRRVSSPSARPTPALSHTEHGDTAPTADPDPDPAPTPTVPVPTMSRLQATWGKEKRKENQSADVSFIGYKSYKQDNRDENVVVQGHIRMRSIARSGYSPTEMKTPFSRGACSR